MDITFDTVRTGSFSMDYCRFGHGEKALVILPGLSVQRVMGFASEVAEAYSLFAGDYTVYLFERRSELPESYSVAEMARDTAEAFRALGLSRVCLFGASQGGMIALTIAAGEPDLVEKLILGSSSSRVADEQYRTIENWSRLAERGEREKLLLTFGEAIYPRDVFAQSRELILETARNVTDADLARFVILARGIRGFDVTADLGKISCPVLVIGSLDDAVVGAEASVEIVRGLKGQKGAVLVLYDGYGHDAYDFAPDYKARMMRFLAGEGAD